MNALAGNRVAVWGSQDCSLDVVGESLARLGFIVQGVDSFEDLRTSIRRDDFDLIVARLCPCFEQPMELLAWVRGVPSAPPVLIVTDDLDVQLYLEAMRRGAFDCIGLPLNEHELVRITSQALQARHSGIAAAGGTR